MADKFDPYREALVIETATIWPEEFDDMDMSEKGRIGLELHADPENAVNLEYLRMHTGFCRKIVVTVDDIQRLAQ